MNKILKVRKVGDYVRYLGGQEQHQLVGIVDYAALSPIRHLRAVIPLTHCFHSVAVSLSTCCSVTVRLLTVR